LGQILTDRIAEAAPRKRLAQPDHRLQTAHPGKDRPHLWILVFHRLHPSQYPLPHPLFSHGLKVDGDGVEASLFQEADLSLQFALPEPLEMGDRCQVAALALQLAMVNQMRLTL
jgi:hypothetical protein